MIRKRSIGGKFGACLYPAGRLCEGKINGDAVSRKECHYGGYHFRDRGKPEVFAAGAKPEKFSRRLLISLAFPLVRWHWCLAGKRFEGGLMWRKRRLGLYLYFSRRVVREPHSPHPAGCKRHRFPGISPVRWHWVPFRYEDYVMEMCNETPSLRRCIRKKCAILVCLNAPNGVVGKLQCATVGGCVAGGQHLGMNFANGAIRAWSGL